MSKIEILSQLEVIFRNIFDNESIQLKETTSADDIEDWDSLAHIQLIEAIQSHFGIKFSAREMLSWENIGDMEECIYNKLK